MGNGEHSGSGTGGNWRIRIATGAGAGVAAALALLLKFDLGSIWLGTLAFVLVVAVGAVLGRLAGYLLFRG